MSIPYGVSDTFSKTIPISLSLDFGVDVFLSNLIQRTDLKIIMKIVLVLK